MRLLAVLAHPDDELFCLGTLATHAARGDEVLLAWTTQGELASRFVEEDEAEVRRIRRGHGAWVAERIGARHRFFDMGDSRMTGGRAEALELARLYAEFRPDAVIAWSDDHAHPDHRASARAAFDAVTLARIPRILAEGRADDPPEALRAPLRFYQHPSPASARPLVHVDVSGAMEVVREVYAFYRDVYGWERGPEAVVAPRRARGRETGVGYAETLQLRAARAPARPFLA